MTFTFPLLLGGLLAIGIPIALHLLLRQKPKTILFPAFRFLVKRHKRNLTKLRLRHLLLLALRVLLFAVMVLALAQPKVKDNPWSLPTDQAVSAVFVFDTSASMGYTVGVSQDRLKDAKKRAIELLQLLPANSEIVALDSAEPGAPISKNDWLTREKAAERIDLLTVQPASSPVTMRLADAVKLLGKIADDKKEPERSKRARVLCVFSDRTKAAWDLQQRKNLQTLCNQVPPAFERLAAVREGITELLQLLPELRQKLPLAASADFPEQVLADRLQKLQERIPQLRADDYPDAEASSLLTVARGKQQDLLALLDKPGENLGEDAKVYRDKLQKALHASLRNSAGFTSFYIDVGVEQPSDLAVLDLQLVPHETGSKLRVELQATGEEFQPTLNVLIDGMSVAQAAIPIKPGKREAVEFDVPDKLLVADLHQAKVFVQSSDSLPINNSRYLTYAVRKMLLLADDPEDREAKLWQRAIQANTFGAALFSCDILRPTAINALDGYDAVFLCSLKAPSEALWAQLKEYVLKGHGVGILPPVDSVEAYQSAAAQEILPAKLTARHRVAKAQGADWNWDDDIYKHSLLQPFKEWRQIIPPPDIFAEPRGAQQYWKVEPRPNQSQVLVRYAESNDPAVLERTVDRKKGRPGRVLLLTTPPGLPEWNNYREGQASFYVILAGRTAAYLTGDLDRQALNFLSSSSGVLVPVPPRLQAESYKLYRESGSLAATFVTNVTAEAHFNEARAQQAAEPGNYKLGDDGGVARFSVNLPAAESDLSRTPVSQIEAVLGHDAVLAVEARTDLQEAMRGHISNPWELFPVLMVVLLVVLAVENLLANRFYRREAPEENAAD
jgi:hypothetical protein